MNTNYKIIKLLISKGVKILYEHYQQEFFRKFKLNRYINTKKSEAKMIDNFTASTRCCFAVNFKWDKFIVLNILNYISCN